MEKVLDQFRKMEISKADLQAFFGNDLHNAECNKPQKITRFDVVNVIQAMLDGAKSVLDVVEWVNVVWFTDLFAFSDDETDSIVSVLEVLETLDEEGEYVRQELECVYTDTQLSFMKGKRGWVKEDCIILIRYSSGDVLVVGTDLVPARCTFESGGSPRTVRLSIKRNSPEFAKILESLS